MSVCHISGGMFIVCLFTRFRFLLAVRVNTLWQWLLQQLTNHWTVLLTLQFVSNLFLPFKEIPATTNMTMFIALVLSVYNMGTCTCIYLYMYTHVYLYMYMYRYVCVCDIIIILNSYKCAVTKLSYWKYLSLLVYHPPTVYTQYVLKPYTLSLEWSYYTFFVV